MGTMGKWDRARIEKFQKALLDAFPSRPALEQLVSYGLDEDLDTLTSDKSLQTAVFELLKWARAQGRLDALLEQARRRNPDNPELRAFAEERVPFLVPFRQDATFFGRDEDLRRLHHVLTNGTAGVQRAALVGMGGVGKTQLALEYAHRHRNDYPGGIYWVNAAAPLVAELANLAERLGLSEDAVSEAERPGRRLRAFERHLYDNPGALVIFDNIVDPLALRKAAAGIVPWELPCRLLVTTQRHDPDAGFETVPLGVLREDAAVRLLLSSHARRGLLTCTRAEERDVARGICRALGYLPLAVALAAAYLGKSPGLPLSDYYVRLSREGALVTADAARVYAVRTPLQHEAMVTVTLRAQWSALGRPAAHDALKAAALLHRAAHVSRATLAHLTGLSDKPKDGYTAPLEEALNELFEWSLAEDATQQEAPSYKAIRLHPLVRDFALRQIDDRDRFAAACARRLGGALGDIGRIEAEVRERGLDAVLADLRLGEALAAPEERERFRRLLRPLDRVAHCLRRWTPEYGIGFFLQQVRNVSFELGMGEVQAQAETALQARGAMWLRERLRTSRESDALVRTLAGHTKSVWAVALLPGGLTAISASHDGTLKQWDISSGCELRTLAGHPEPANGVAVTPDGRFAVSASEDATLKVWDLATGHELRTLTGHTAPVNGVATTPDGRFAVSASTDGALNVWDLATGRPVRTLSGHSLPVNSVAVTPDGRLAVSASEDCTLKVFEIATGRLVHTLEGHVEGVLDVAVTPDGRLAISASADHTLKVWDLRHGREIRPLRGHKNWVNGVAVTPDGRFAVSASSDNTLKLWELSSGNAIHTLEGHAEPVKEVAVTPDGRLAISTSHDNTLKVWELSRGREVCAHEGHACEVSGIAVTPDGHYAVTASWDRVLKLWELSTRAHVRTLEGHTALVMRVAVTPDGLFAISASEDTTLNVWELSTGQRRALTGHTWGVTGVAVTPDGRFAVSASRDRTLKIWELSTGRALNTLTGHTAGVNAVAVTPDGRWIISTSEDKSLKVWSLSSGDELFELPGHSLSVTSVAVTSDGRFAISASEDMTLKVWSLETTKETCTLRGHTAIVTGVAVIHDGRLAISTSEDTTLRVWDLREERCIATLEAHTPLLGCAIGPGGRTFLAGDGAGGLHVLDWIDPATESPDIVDAQPVARDSDEEAHSPRPDAAPATLPRRPSGAAALRSASIKGGAGDTPAKGGKAAVGRRRDPTAREVRDLVMDVLRSDSDLDAFCFDHFPGVHARFTNGMDRIMKVTTLLQHVPLKILIEALPKRRPRKPR
ncbi:effector-associated domain EAD1-containing protein [Sorangium sp. So ce291]|uniref:effector-associated domain EAD1-containing protein n=1 Tax=Sorangium sp. So ce291 TaxID=3133294 RepID=UPI003F5EE4AE